MFKEIVKVFGETVVYGFAGIASTLASLLLVPIYTRVLNPADYGVVTILTTISNIVGVVAVAGIGWALFWAYFKAKKRERKSVVGTALVFQTIFPLAITLVVFALSHSLSSFLFRSDRYANLITLSAVIMFFNAGIGIPLALLRANSRPTKYVVVNLIKIVSTVVLAFALVAGFNMGVEGAIWANLLGCALGYLAGLVFTFGDLSLSFSVRWLKEMLSFGAPLIPAGLAMWVLNSSDRYFLNAFVGTSEVGLYNVGYKVGMLVSLVVGAITLAYPRFMFFVYNEKPNPQDYYRRANTYFFLITFWFALSISIFAKEAIGILTGPLFHDAYPVVPLIAFSYVASGLYQNFGTGATVVKKTYLSTVAAAIAGVANLVMNYLLIKSFGMMGAAISTLVSFILLAFIQLYFSQKVYPISFEFRRMLIITIVGGLLVYLATLIEFGFVLSLVVKVIIFAVFPILLFFLGFFEEGELRKFSQIWDLIKSGREGFGRILDTIKQEVIS